MSRFSGAQERHLLFAKGKNKGVLAWAKARRREEALDRDAETRPGRRSTKKRVKREKGTRPAETAVAVTAPGCPWPWKDRHPSRQAAAGALRRVRHEDPDGYRTAEAYACPAVIGEGAHWHVGHPAVPAERGRKERGKKEEAA